MGLLASEDLAQWTVYDLHQWTDGDMYQWIPTVNTGVYQYITNDGVFFFDTKNNNFYYLTIEQLYRINSKSKIR